MRFVDVLLRWLDSGHIRLLLPASSLFYINLIANTVRRAAAVRAGPAGWSKVAVGLVSEALAFFSRYFFAAAFFVRLLVAGCFPPPSSASRPRSRLPTAHKLSVLYPSPFIAHTVDSVVEAVERLSRRDAILKEIDLVGNQLTDSELAELVGCLLAIPTS